MDAYQSSFFSSLFLTVAVETAVLLILVRRLFRNKKGRPTTPLIIASGILASSLTLPYVWFVLPQLVHNYQLYALASESFAAIAEAPALALVMRIRIKDAFFLSLVCNLASFLVGMLIL